MHGRYGTPNITAWLRTIAAMPRMNQNQDTGKTMHSRYFLSENLMYANI